LYIERQMDGTNRLRQPSATDNNIPTCTLYNKTDDKKIRSSKNDAQYWLNVYSVLGVLAYMYVVGKENQLSKNTEQPEIGNEHKILTLNQHYDSWFVVSSFSNSNSSWHDS